MYARNLPDYTTADGKMLTTIQLAVDAGYRERKTDELERAKANAIEWASLWRTARPSVTASAPTAAWSPTQRRRPRSVRCLSCAPPEPDRPPWLTSLKAHSVRTSQGAATWSKGAVQSVISSRVYLGELSYGTDRRYVNPESHEPIIDRATWEAAQHQTGAGSAAHAVKATTC